MTLSQARGHTRMQDTSESSSSKWQAKFLTFQHTLISANFDVDPGGPAFGKSTSSDPSLVDGVTG
jgi:hypothetical protein